jgi:hypothetical protein
LTADPTLGVAGTAYLEEGFDSTKDSFEGAASVHGHVSFSDINVSETLVGMCRIELEVLIG